LSPNPEPSTTLELRELGVLSVRGGDALAFLQGQLSSDITRLEAEGSQLAGYHNPQGRTIAVVRLGAVRGQVLEVLAVMPRELIAPVAARLGRFVLRAKVQLVDASASWRVRGLVQPHAPAPPSGADAVTMKAGDSPTRWLALEPQAAPHLTSAAPAMAQSAWRLLDIAAGIPQVYARTSEAFVAQMLNLDLLGGIAFSKGCYTGQEVIARAHYRGRVKRRMQRWRTRERAELAPGDTGRLADGRVYRVVESVQLADGRCEFLAVAPLDARPEAEPEGEPAGSAQSVIDAEQLPLPYELP